MVIPSFLKYFAVFVVGIVVGLAFAVGLWLFAHRHTDVYTTKIELQAEGIVIPAGTELVHDEAMAEGFDRLRLYINVDGPTLESSFVLRRDPRPELVIPYWVAATKEYK